MINTKYKVAKYIRLSDEDRDKKESESVENQRDIIHNFIEKNIDLEEFDEYVNDGYTGGNFERPRFKQMLKDIEDGIDTKDAKGIQFLKMENPDNEILKKLVKRIEFDKNKNIKV